MSEDEAVKVTATDYNGRTWDGSPFSSLPEWLKDAIEQELVSVEPSNTDYALWRVVTVVGPGDQIVRSSLASPVSDNGDDVRKEVRKALGEIREICRLATMSNWRCEEIDKIALGALEDVLWGDIKR